MRTLVRWLVRAVAAVVVLIALTAGAVWALSARRLAAPAPVAAEPVLETAPTPERLARGEHVATALGKCAVCHGEDLGGAMVLDVPEIGTVWAANLTPGRGGIAALSDAQIEAAVRHGVRRDGRSLWVMPSVDWQGMSDEDMGALVAYLRSLPPVDREGPPLRLGPVGRVLFLAGELPVRSVDEVRPDAHAAPVPPAGPTAEYGRYLADIGGCTGCHGPGLSGGPIPGAPPEWRPATNISPTGIGAWTEEDFFVAMRDGKRPDGSAIQAPMPIPFTKRMTDDEIRAVYAYLRTVPAKAYGGR